MKTKLLSVESVLPNAARLFQMFCGKLKELGLDVTRVGGMVSDGASVIPGRNNGVAAKLKAIIVPPVVVVQCVCHRLASACADSNQELNFLTELRKLFQFSYQKIALQAPISARCEDKNG